MKMKNPGQVLSYLFLIALAAVLGILSRKFGNLLPTFIALYAGDTLWAFALYFIVSLFSLKRSFGFRFWSTCLLSVVDELLQLYHAPWIDGLRSLPVGALILGNQFVWSDLLCYLAGTAGALVVDYSMVKTRV